MSNIWNSLDLNEDGLVSYDSVHSCDFSHLPGLTKQKKGSLLFK